MPHPDPPKDWPHAEDAEYAEVAEKKKRGEE
jgi:hypothetical protein